jgi:hypothetical protein
VNGERLTAKLISSAPAPASPAGGKGARTARRAKIRRPTTAGMRGPNATSRTFERRRMLELFARKAGDFPEARSILPE